MENTRYVQLSCPVCGLKTLIIGTRSAPTRCARCEARQVEAKPRSSETPPLTDARSSLPPEPDH
jgi:hypothetical protein